MTSLRLLQVSKGDLCPLNSLTSSTAPFVARLLCKSLLGAKDPADMIIAQGLLRADGLQVPSRHSSISSSMHGLPNPTFQGDDLQLESDMTHKARHSRQGISSNTWTSSSGEGADDGGYEDRTPFVQEYNRLAMKYGIQPIVPDDLVTISVNYTPAFLRDSRDNDVVKVDTVTPTTKQGSWIMRKLLRRTSSIQPDKHASVKHTRHKRSISDLSIRMRLKKDALKDKDLEELVRLCGVSALYLPAEYAPSTLAVPTCFRAAAQYLVQHGADSRGIFRIPGSHSTVNALYNHYATQDEEGEVINGTVRCPTLPEHIPYNVHDVASAFKKFLAGLPGGILGRTWLFDAFLSVYSQLDATAELTRTKQSKVRARLIALAVACITLRYQRELICAVIGLLSMIGRASETAPREDEHGRPLPTSDLMGYKALGIVFGPLLIGELIDNHDLYPSSSHGPLTYIQRSPLKSSKGKPGKTKTIENPNILMQNTDKIRVINSITEMLITHWRDVVRHMKSLGVLRPGKEHQGHVEGNTRAFLRPSLSETFVLRKPPEWSMEKASVRQMDWNGSPTPSSRNERRNLSPPEHGQEEFRQESLSIRKRRPRPKPMTSQILSNARSMSILSPTKEESFIGNGYERLPLQHNGDIRERDSAILSRSTRKPTQSAQTFHTANSGPTNKADLGYPMRITSSPRSDQIQEKSIHEELINKSNAKQFSQASNNLEQKSLTSRMISLLENIVDEPANNTGDNAGGLYDVAGASSKTSTCSERSKCSHTLPREPRTLASFVRRSRGNQVEQDASLLVPLGIVSRRLGEIVTGEPCSQPPSSLHVLPQYMNVDNIERVRKPRVGLSSSQNFRSQKTDPLVVVSYEEDLASLALLAKAISSQDEGVTASPLSDSKPVQHRFTHMDVVKVQDTISQYTILENAGVQQVSDDKVINGKETNPNPTQKSQFKRAKACVTPTRDETDSSAQGHRIGSSVRALAARFDKSHTNLSPSSSPIKTPDPRQVYGHHLESSVVSSHTINASPVSGSQKSNTSDRSLQAVRNPCSGRIYNSLSPEKSGDTRSPMPPKCLFVVAAPQNDGIPRQEAKSHLPVRSPRTDPILTPTRRSKTASIQVSSTLQITGDGPSDMAMLQKLSVGTISPGPEPVLVDETTQPGWPFVSELPQSLSTSEFVSVGPGLDAPLAQGLCATTIACKQQNIRGNSMLYSQIQELQTQLKAKTEEFEQLRRQFLTKESLNELSALRKQLRQTERDLEVWRNRAEIAEKILASPSILYQEKDLSVCTKNCWRVREQFDAQTQSS